ncbi:MAG: FAD:protein FMN transferase [Pseudomonadota bacterium]
MSLSRRRVLAVTACALGAPASAAPRRWQGQAMGADMAIKLRAPEAQARPALEAALRVLRRIEAEFSLYDPASRLMLLNRTGRLDAPSRDMRALLSLSDRVHILTGGLFDPSVQPLWKALSEGRAPDETRKDVGWSRVRVTAKAVELDPGMALTFNGIAQGYATDRVADILRANGLTDVLVDLGEQRALGGPWQLGLVDPEHGLLGQRTLTNAAIATSSPMATPLASQGHILHPTRSPLWSTVSVEAPEAALADALSTALVLADQDEISAIRHALPSIRVTIVDPDGNLRTI